MVVRCIALLVYGCRRTGEGGHGLALAAVIIGYVSLGLVVLVVLFYIVVLVGILGTVAATAGSYDS
ncbi:hypothetical protein HII28_10635 [Planctomonas sp. JC2975]|uniref:hypothetical protein n=1 Tax=Planctomonas sp. JC2975 TaxID=2729626 RepID=UPI0014743EFD|nr:hypothetical protein [Planctomonas sp. JC2975]NNC12330.1 hypothetical protein [Planctomonas sp. JC2975]